MYGVCLGYPGVFGVDMSVSISKGISVNDWRCMREKGNYTFAIIEGFQGGYGRNDELARVVSRAWDGGMHHVDVYSFMCPNCAGNGRGAVKELVDYLRNNDVRFGQIWLDVEQCTNCWHADKRENCKWVGSLVDQYRAMGVSHGIYASPYEWSITVGDACDYSHLPLWWADYDGKPDFSGFRSFGGWKRPAMHQFADHADNSCGISVDRNWYPA